jgi:hypothetical protein
VRLASRELEWDMTEPMKIEADSGAVSALLTKILTTEQMKSVEPPDAGDPAKYGLDTPVASITLGMGETRSTLQVGGPAGENLLYARDTSRPFIFTIDKSIGEELTKEASALRSKDIFAFQTYDAERLEVTRGGQTTIYEKSKPTEKEPQTKWRELSPTARDVDTAKMDAALSKLSFLRAASFVDPKRTRTGLERPAFTSVVKSSEGKREDRARLASVGAEGYAARAAWSDAALLDASAYKLLVESLNDLEK